MKTSLASCAAAILVVGALAASDPPAAPTVKVGSKAPALGGSKWVQGEPVAKLVRGKTYIVEFWATWCGPCRVSIPHLNELHSKFKSRGLVVIGQDVWEQDQDLVAPFVKKMGERMTYRVALDTLRDDEDKGTMARTWMEAAAQNGIPAAFVVDRSGKVAWIGHPLKLKEDLIEQVMSGHFDMAKAAKEYEQRLKDEEQAQPLWQEYNVALRARNWDKAEAALAGIEKLTPVEDRDDLGTTRFRLFMEREDYPKAIQLASRFSEAHPDDVMSQNFMAWALVTHPKAGADMLEAAEKIARRGVAASKFNDGQKAEILDTLARALFLRGNKEPALTFETQAVEYSEDSRQRQFKRNLEDFKAGRVPDEAKLERQQRDLSMALRKHDWAGAETSVLALEKVLTGPDREPLVAARIRILLGREDYAAAEKMAEQLIAGTPDGREALNDVAWSIASAQEASPQALGLAEKLARRASEAASGRSTAVLDTLARVLFRQGRKPDAIELQQRAVGLARGRNKTELKKTLASYQAGMLPPAN